MSIGIVTFAVLFMSICLTVMACGDKSWPFFLSGAAYARAVHGGLVEVSEVALHPLAQLADVEVGHLLQDDTHLVDMLVDILVAHGV